jgi:hypothetical protein
MSGTTLVFSKAWQLRAIATGARRDGRIYFKFDVGED